MVLTKAELITAGPVAVEDRPVSGTPPMRRVKPIAPGYFETMGNPVVAGRAITWTDIHQTALVAVISENLAREYREKPAKALGKRLEITGPKEWSEIVGVVGNERLDGLNKPAPTTVYRPMTDNRDMAYVVRSPAMFLTRVMSALLFGVTPTDPVTYAAAAAGVAAVALLATYLPARRASGIDPIVALRSGM